MPPLHNQQQQSHQNQQGQHPPLQSPLKEKPPNQKDFERDPPPPRPQPTPPQMPEPPMDQPNMLPMQDRRNNKRKMRGPMPPPQEGYRYVIYFYLYTDETFFKTQYFALKL